MKDIQIFSPQLDASEEIGESNQVSGVAITATPAEEAAAVGVATRQAVATVGLGGPGAVGIATANLLRNQ